MLRNLKQFNPPEIEEKVLEFWKTNDIFGKSLKRNQKKKFVFYEGPPTANGRPGIHHVLGRVFKDIILRYKAMRGFSVPRRAGWDTHGLPVEVEVEKQLGVKTKSDIEKFGIDLFNQKAKETVWLYKDEWEKLTARIGYWLDIKNPYVTYDNSYIESLWWILGEVAKKKLLKKDYRVGPYCPRCETVLSAAELGQPGVYKKVPDPSVYVKFKLKRGAFNSKGDKYLLVWTTTPWTLPANVAVAVNPQLTYTKYKVIGENGKAEYLWSFNPPPDVFGRTIEVTEKISGKKLVGLEYEPLYRASFESPAGKKYFSVLGADFVSTEDGTGLVHIAPAFGEDDFQLIKKEYSGLTWKNVPLTINDSGKVKVGFPGANKFVKQADKEITEDLEKRGILYKKATVDHEYPFCWRCGTHLLYMARSSWFIEMSKLRSKLVASNKRITWIPDYIKEGRFGNWIAEEKDWAISRQRYWGTPLPIWECGECGETKVIASLAELDKLAFSKNKFLLLRHAEAEHNVSDFFAAGPAGKNINLTAKGKTDAEKIAKKLSAKKVDLIFSSPYKRAKDTAELIAKSSGAAVVTDKRLEELNGGVFNGRPISEHKNFFANPLEEFTKTPSGGENLNDVKKRMLDFVKEMNREHNGKTILIVSHGDPLWVLEGAMKGLANEEILTLSDFQTGELKDVPFHNWPFDKDGNLDLHRPFVDELALKCGKCKGKMTRVKEVADVWFDSGAMPFASVHWPFTDAQNQKSKIKNQKLEKLDFPADYICEAVDQTRGWFHTLLAVATLLGKKEPYKHVISHGHVLDKFGQKMSKSKGNVVNPWDVINKYGVDAVRWYFYTVNPPGEPKRFDEAEVKKTLNKFIMILYNSYVFYSTYAKQVLEGNVTSEELSLLDKWILARVNETKAQATADLENYEIGGAAKSIESLIDDLSRWYIRRSRRRLQKPENQSDYAAASATLNTVLLETSRMIAPFAPFFAEALFQSVKAKGAGLSVHLESWPEADKKKKEEKLLAGMKWVRDIAAQALAKRAEAGIKVRQPLQRLVVGSQLLDATAELLNILKDEINVKEIVLDPKLKNELELDTNITPELKEEGLLREFVRTIQELRQSARLTPRDAIVVYVESEFSAILASKERDLKKETGALELQLRRADKLDAEIETEINGNKAWVGIKKK